MSGLRRYTGIGLFGLFFGTWALGCKSSSSGSDAGHSSDAVVTVDGTRDTADAATTAPDSAVADVSPDVSPDACTPAGGCVAKACTGDNYAAGTLAAGPDGGTKSAYTFEDLGGLPGGTRAQGGSNNNAGVIAGTSNTGTNMCGQAIRVRAGNAFDLIPGLIADSLCSGGTKINASGMIAYHQGPTAGPYRVWRYTDGGGAQDLGLPTGATNMVVGDLNDKGQVVSTDFGTKNSSFYATAYRYSDGPGWEALPAPVGSTSGCGAFSISSAGNTVGGQCGADPVWWQKSAGGQWTVEALSGCLAAGSGWVLTSGTVLSHDGQYLFGMGKLNGAPRGWVFDTVGKTINDIGIIVATNDTNRVEPTGMNSRGDIVGNVVVAGSLTRGFLYTKARGVEYLDELVTLPAGDNLLATNGISDNGQIVGEVGLNPQSVTHVFVMKPK